MKIAAGPLAAKALICACLLLPRIANGVEVLAVAKPPTIDGVLVEWGAPEGVSILPGGEGVGVRGAFDGPADHEVDLYLMWDADFLYAAVVVVDDTTDVGRIPPGDNVWQGPSGERKDQMFYFDHLKVYLRNPKAPLGYNVWFGPTDEKGSEPYFWGGRQRDPVSADIPVRIGSTWRGGIYTYELAFPWSWLTIHPQPGMELETMFLLPDSDLPGEEMRKKVRESNKWIWWKGTARLVGKPPGLKPPPQPVAVEEIQKEIAAIELPKVEERREEKEEGEVEGGREEPVGTGEESSAPVASAPKGEEAVEEADGAQEEVDSGQGETETFVSAATLRSRLNRQLLGRTRVPGAPAWVKALGPEIELKDEKVDSLYHRLIVTLNRLAESGVNSRTDGLVMDIAEYAGTWRAQAQRFLVAISKHMEEELKQDGGLGREKIARAAEQVGIDEEQGVRLVADLCTETRKLYEEGKIKTSSDLLERAQKKADLTEDQARDFIRELVADWKE